MSAVSEPKPDPSKKPAPAERLPSGLKGLRYRVEAIGFRALLRYIPKLSRMRCVKLALLLGDLTYFFDFRGRAVALANLECAFGDQYTPAQRRWIARLSYRNFARAMVDLFWGSSRVHTDLKQYISRTGVRETRDRMDREGRGAVFMCIHAGNWEWASLAGLYDGVTNTVVTEELKNPLLAPFFFELRETSGQRMIPQENAVVRLLKIVKRGGSVGALVDLGIRPSQAATPIQVFGMTVCVPAIHALLAQRANAMLVAAETESLPDGTCRVTAHPPIEIAPDATLQQIAQQCWDVFEPTLRKRPDLWLWPYKHFRYRPRNATRPYPFYANESSQFEKVLKAAQQ